MTNRPDNEKPTAAETYAARANDIARLIDLLQAELERHAEDARENPANWGHAGDLGKVRGDLIEVLGFVSGFERGEIEAHLAE